MKNMKETKENTERWRQTREETIQELSRRTGVRKEILSGESWEIHNLVVMLLDRGKETEASIIALRPEIVEKSCPHLLEYVAASLWHDNPNRKIDKQWITYSRDDVQLILENIDERPMIWYIDMHQSLLDLSIGDNQVNWKSFSVLPHGIVF